MVIQGPLATEFRPVVSFVGLDASSDDDFVWDLFTLKRAGHRPQLLFKKDTVDSLSCVNPVMGDVGLDDISVLVHGGWLASQVYSVPAVIVVFFHLDWTSPDLYSDKQRAVDLCHSIRSVMDPKVRPKYILVMVQPKVAKTDPGQHIPLDKGEIVTSICTDCGISTRCFFTLNLDGSATLHTAVVAIEKAVHDLALNFYHQRIKSVGQLDVVDSTRSQLGTISLFESAVYNELKGDLSAAVKLYVLTHEALVQSSDTWSLLSTSAALVIYKILTLNLKLKLVREATNRFNQHTTVWSALARSRSVCDASLSSWLAAQHAMFASAIESSPQDFAAHTLLISENSAGPSWERAVKLALKSCCEPGIAKDILHARLNLVRDYNDKALSHFRNAKLLRKASVLLLRQADLVFHVECCSSNPDLSAKIGQYLRPIVQHFRSESRCCREEAAVQMNSVRKNLMHSLFIVYNSALASGPVSIADAVESGLELASLGQPIELVWHPLTANSLNIQTIIDDYYSSRYHSDDATRAIFKKATSELKRSNLPTDSQSASELVDIDITDITGSPIGVVASFSTGTWTEQEQCSNNIVDVSFKWPVDAISAAPTPLIMAVEVVAAKADGQSIEGRLSNSVNIQSLAGQTRSSLILSSFDGWSDLTTDVGSLHLKSASLVAGRFRFVNRLSARCWTNDTSPPITDMHRYKPITSTITDDNDDPVADSAMANTSVPCKLVVRTEWQDTHKCHIMISFDGSCESSQEVNIGHAWIMDNGGNSVPNQMPFTSLLPSILRPSVTFNLYFAHHKNVKIDHPASIHITWNTINDGTHQPSTESVFPLGRYAAKSARPAELVVEPAYEECNWPGLIRVGQMLDLVYRMTVVGGSYLTYEVTLQLDMDSMQVGGRPLFALSGTRQVQRLTLHRGCSKLFAFQLWPLIAGCVAPVPPIKIFDCTVADDSATLQVDMSRTPDSLLVLPAMDVARSPSEGALPVTAP